MRLGTMVVLTLLAPALPVACSSAQDRACGMARERYEHRKIDGQRMVFVRCEGYWSDSTAKRGQITVIFDLALGDKVQPGPQWIREIPLRLVDQGWKLAADIKEAN